MMKSTTEANTSKIHFNSSLWTLRGIPLINTLLFSTCAPCHLLLLVDGMPHLHHHQQLNQFYEYFIVPLLLL
jgi:hypothetical protein